MVQQGVQVHLNGDRCIALGGVTREVLFEGESAAQVIQQAIDRQGAGGGEVLLEQGTFELDRPLALHNQVTLSGKGRGSRLLVSERNVAGIGILGETLDGACVSNLALTGRGNPNAKVGILFDACGDSRVVDVFVAGFAEYGIWLRNSCFLCEVRACQLAGNGRANLFLEHLAKGRIGDYISNSVIGCTIYGGGRGIDMLDAVVTNVIGCAVFQTNDTGYHVRDRCNSVLISGCRTFQITGCAVVIENSEEINITGNIFCWHTGHGIRVQKCAWGLISGNECIDTGSFNPGVEDQTMKFSELGDLPAFDAIHVEQAKGLNITGNTLFNWPQGTQLARGVYVDGASFKCSVTSNNINYYRDGDVVCESRESLVANNVGHGELPHHGSVTRALIQSFQSERVRAFIERQW